MIQTIKIKQRMLEMGISQTDLASRMGLAPCSVNQKLNRVRPMTLDEAERLCDVLNIGPSDFGAYFFGD